MSPNWAQARDRALLLNCGFHAAGRPCGVWCAKGLREAHFRSTRQGRLVVGVFLLQQRSI